jgi:NAD(P)H-flavin reductase/ferredoxin
MSPRVRFEPLGEEIDCGPEETVLEAAFRQGYNLAYGCREGQCSACKGYLLEGEVDLKRYSSFALSDSERGNGYALMCRALPESDLVIELLHYDPDNYRLENAIREVDAEVVELVQLTHDIVGLTLSVPEDFSWLPGQYVDVQVPGSDGARRSFSIANLPDSSHPPQIELMIKRYPGGRFSSLLGNEIRSQTHSHFRPGDETESDSHSPPRPTGEIESDSHSHARPSDEADSQTHSHLRLTGPYGAFHLRRSERPILMIAGGSGMAPVLGVLRQLASEGCGRPVRFFYGAREERDLFALEEIRALGERLADFSFSPVTGRFVHEVVDEYLEDCELGDLDVYMCGPPPMLEAAEEMLAARGQDPSRIFQDKFTTSADADADADADAGARPTTSPQSTPDSERDFAWFAPSGRRATLYEDVTIDTQPSIHRHLRRGWPVSFEDGRGTWNDASTALRCADWFCFRDPGENWERTFYQAGTAVEQQIDSALRSAAAQGLLDDFAPVWVQFLRSTLQVPAFVEHGLWFALATAARDALSDSVATCMCLQAAMKQRSAQAIVLYAMDLEPHLGELPMPDARAAFMRDEAWQPARRYLERLAATPDWAEVVFAANLCFEPTVATLIRRELGTRAAAAHGDMVTPVLARVETQEWEWARAWTVALARFALAEGADNRAVLAGWVSDWLPQALAAMTALTAVAQPLGVDADQASERVLGYAGQMLADAGLPELCHLVGHEPTPAAHSPSAPVSPAAPRPPRNTSRPRRSVPPARAPSAGPDGTAPALDKAGWLASQPTAGAGASSHHEAGASGHHDAGASSDHGTYDFVGIVMAKSAEGDAVARFLTPREGVQVIEQPSFWDIRARDRLIIPYDQISDELGYEIDAYSIQHEMSTHYGRMVATDDSLMLFSDPTEAMEHLLR